MEVTWDDIGGLDDVKELQELVQVSVEDSGLTSLPSDRGHTFWDPYC